MNRFARFVEICNEKQKNNERFVSIIFDLSLLYFRISAGYFSVDETTHSIYSKYWLLRKLHDTAILENIYSI